MLHQNQLSKKLVFLALLVLFAIACDTASRLLPSSSTTPVPFTPAPFIPGDPTATPFGSEITDPNFIAGLTAFNEEDYDQAVALMSAVIDVNPNLAPPYRYRATSYWYLNNCEAGLADAEKAIAINPNYAAAWAACGLMYDTCFGDDTRTLQSYEKALWLDPSLSFVHYNLGVYYYDRGDYQKSLDEYSLSATIDPTRSEAWGGAGQALTALGRFEECIEYTTKAIEVNAEEWLAYSGRAFCYTRVENHAAAAEDYRSYIAQNADDSIAWYNYGISQSKLGDPQGALDSYNRSLELNPEYPSAYINRGHVYNELQQYQKAIDDFNTALMLGETAFAYSGRGDSYYWQENYDQAIADYETALSMYPGSAHCHCYLALSYFELGRYQEVLDEAQASNDIDPSCGGAKLFEVQARSYYALEDYDQALVYMDQALELDQYSFGYYYRGMIYQALGRNQEAIQDLELFLSVTTNFPEEITDAEARLSELKK